MIVPAKHLPDFDELLLTLKHQYLNYEVYILHSIPLKSIIVQKSAIIGAQITLSDNQMMVDACCPNIFLSALIGIMGGVLPPFMNFEMKITNFLKKKYN
jgi:hypothetical protein